MVTQPTLMRRYVDKILVHALSHKQQLMVKNVQDKKIHVIRQFDYQYLLEFSNNNAITRSDDFILKDNYILFFGNIAPWKGIDTLIEAVKIV
jgi:glycosyltransferase involved in cell wall biosynthesis